jgi:hypothetical protein
VGWNGADLVDDFSAELGDTSSTFKTKVLRWLNDGIRDISTSHQWPFLREKGKVILTSGQDTHSIVLSAPSAPTLAALSGGTLTDATSYKVLITFYEGASGVESIAGEESASLTTASPNQSITVSGIPVSSSTLVTARRVYLSKAGAAFYLYSTISNNTATTTTITADTSSTVTPPDENAIHMVDGDFYLEDERIIEGYSLQRLIFETNGIVSNGTPLVWAPINQEDILVYPRPGSNISATFYYFKLPGKVFNSSTSRPEIPSWLFEQLHDYVIWRGFQYRDRAGQESKKLNYDQGLRMAISKKGRAIKRSGRVRSVTPDSDGYCS